MIIDWRATPLSDHKQHKRFRFACFFLLFIFSAGILTGLAACSHPQPPVQSGLLIDPAFTEFYAQLNGEEWLGTPISALFQKGDLNCQYTMNALMCYNPLITGLERFHLEPVGKELGLIDQPLPNPESDSTRIVDGYPIYPDFIPIYDSLYGALYAGHPISNPRFNNEQRRVEQYFENLGFYHRFDDPAGTVYPLEYGAYTCETECQATPGNFIPNTSVSSPFWEPLQLLGGYQVFGMPISEPYVAADGFLEQVFENVVVYAPVGEPGEMLFRPLPFLVGIPAIQPGPRRYGVAENVIFYATDGELGYHVPIVFDEFISSHGGTQLSGKPIGDPSYYPGVETPRQCFQNYCLDYYANSVAESHTQLAHLGIIYLQMTRPEENLCNLSGTEVSFVMNEAFPQVSAQQAQVFQVVVFMNANQQPVRNIEARLALTAPDGSVYTFQFPPTGNNGIAQISVAPFEDIKNGSLIVYQVCLNIPQPPPCATDAYLIWN
jgi:hypothetical protein